MKPAGASPFPRRAWTQNPVVRTLTTSTTNITGLRTIFRGCKLLEGLDQGVLYN